MSLMAIFAIITIKADLESRAVENYFADIIRMRGKERKWHLHNDKREKIAKLTLRRTIGAKFLEVADKTSTGAIARAFPAGVKDSSEILKLFKIDRRLSREVTPPVFLVLAVDYVCTNWRVATILIDEFHASCKRIFVRKRRQKFILHTLFRKMKRPDFSFRFSRLSELLIFLLLTPRKST